VFAIDTLHANFADETGLRRAAENARADGFAGMLAIHPAQVPVINAAFTPSDSELAEARAIVDAFAANADAGTLQIDGRMIDRPHLVLARRILGLHA
jgi:citrate lyase subunit beta / citryl-CoA lyase